MKKVIQHILFFSLSFCFSSGSLLAQSWSELGGVNGLDANGYIVSICSDAVGNIYAAGDFGDNTGDTYIAKFDGNMWNNIGPNNSVDDLRSLCIDNSGHVCVTKHDFFTVPPYSTYYVAHDLGGGWSELAGTNSLAANWFVNKICCDISNNIYATGDFTNGSNHNYVAKFDGTSWSELGGLNGLAPNGGIYDVCSDSMGNIFAAGDFRNSSNKMYVAKYDGTSWSELGGLNGLAVYGGIYSICSDGNGNIYAAGTFTNSSGNYYVAKYDGISWSELGGLNGLAANNYIYSICSDGAGNIYAGGDFTNSMGNRYLAKFDGTSWSELGGLNNLAANDFISTICSDGIGNIYTAGDFKNSVGRYYVAKYSSCNSHSNINITSCNSYTTAGGITYYTSGIYNDQISNAAGCDSVITVNLTINPLPVAQFTVYHDTLIAHNWFALNQCTGTPPLSYLWNWGDSTATSTGATPSHVYADSGYYNICVTVTDGNGCSHTYCDSSTFIYKGNNTNSIITINVVMSLPNGIEDIDGNSQVTLSPNPATNHLTITLPNISNKVTLTIADITGKIIYNITDASAQKIEVNTKDFSGGVYFVQIQTPGFVETKKLVVAK